MNTTIVNPESENVNPFEQLKRQFETDYLTGDYATSLLDLSRAVASSVIRKCLDPQRKTATKADHASNCGYNPAMVALWRGIHADAATISNTQYSTDAATEYRYNAAGDMERVIINHDANDAAARLTAQALTDGIDLVHTAAVALLDQAAEHSHIGYGWLDIPYTVRRLSRRVYIRMDDAAEYRDEETLPIREVYRAVRREIMQSRAMATDPRNGYTYLEDYTEDGLETIYRRLGKYADLGGYETSSSDGCTYSGGGNYTVSPQMVRDYDAIMNALRLTDRQMSIVQLRMRGYGYKAIATYLGIAPGAVQNTMLRLRKRCEEIGFTPDMWREMNRDNDND